MEYELLQPESDPVSNGERFWTMPIDSDMEGYDVFGVETRGIVDEEQGGIVAYAHVDNAEAIIIALRAYTGEV